MPPRPPACLFMTWPCRTPKLIHGEESCSSGTAVSEPSCHCLRDKELEKKVLFTP